MRTRILPALLATVAALAGGVVCAAGAVVPVSRSDQTGSMGRGGSFGPVFSADGRTVAFVSYADDLVTNDNGAPFLDVFVRNLTTGRTVLASVNTSGVGGGDDNANYPAISSNGRYVVFASAAGNLAPGDSNGASDIFVRDLEAGTTAVASVDPSGAVPLVSPLGSANPVISADGRWVFFESLAGTLVPPPGPGGPGWHVYARDLQAGLTELVSVPLPFTGSLDPWARCELASITPDGRRVAFVSAATNLVAEVTTGRMEVYVRDRLAGVTLWASRDVEPYFAPASGGFRSLRPVLSANGRYVAFKAASPDAEAVLVFRHDLEAGTTLLLASNSVPTSEPALSSDGRYVAYETDSNVCVWDAEAGRTILVSVNRTGTGPGNGPSGTPALAADGLKVAFLSVASDLGAQGGNGYFQMYVRDIARATTRLISAAPEGTPSLGDLALILPAIAADGSQTAFDSLAADLGPMDANQARDVFAQSLGLLDVDGDSLDDDWEMAYFGALTRAGAGDLDQDGMSDYGEFMAGTDPTNPGSLVRAVAASSVTISWVAAPGKSYKVQYCSNLTGMAWTDLPGLVVVNGENAFQVDATMPGQGQRFYRVVVVP